MKSLQMVRGATLESPSPRFFLSLQVHLNFGEVGSGEPHNYKKRQPAGTVPGLMLKSCSLQQYRSTFERVNILLLQICCEMSSRSCEIARKSTGCCLVYNDAGSPLHSDKRIIPLSLPPSCYPLLFSSSPLCPV